MDYNIGVHMVENFLGHTNYGSSYLNDLRETADKITVRIVGTFPSS